LVSFQLGQGMEHHTHGICSPPLGKEQLLLFMILLLVLFLSVMPLLI